MCFYFCKPTYLTLYRPVLPIYILIKNHGIVIMEMKKFPLELVRVSGNPGWKFRGKDE